ncbi:unnamed protein product [Adineta steineri]|uniref:TRPM SLOG domain-containing protein n=1 Tax=Adineta steineri TaxID=433720 RepID=A0A818YLE6_9BILA|nr:unnamed protein product [Adineta steineri]
MNQPVVIGEIVPVATIVVGGGKDTITNIYYDLRDNIPVVIIDNSGRVAGFLKRWLLYTKKFDEATKYPQYPYEIDKATSVTAFSPTSQDTRSAKIGAHQTVQEDVF